jgi:citrate lyase subunit beta/citryl-CoA lyase
MAPRSYLFVPGDRPERFDKALASAADAVMLDLEDAVAAEHKAQAREQVARFLAGTAQRSRLIVRITDSATPWVDDDLALLRASAAGAAMWPKAETPEALARLRAACPQIEVLALIESARGVLAADTLAACPGVTRLAFGSVDFALDLQLPDDSPVFDIAAARIALASRAAGLSAPVAGVSTAIDDADALQADVRHARSLGFTAKLCIHPQQIGPVHAAFAPSADEIERARRIVAAAGQSGGAAGRVDGRMVDRPVLLRAQQLLQRAAERSG